MDDSFWERRTTFWKDNEPSPGPVQTGDEANFWKDEEPGRGTRPARVEPRARRRSRRVRVRTNKRLAAVVALASAACIVFVYGLLASDVSRAPDGGRAARATDGTQTDGHAGSASSGPLVNAIPVASLRDEPRDLATTPGAAPGSGAAASQTPGASGSGGATSGTSSGSAATKSTSSPSGGYCTGTGTATRTGTRTRTRARTTADDGTAGATAATVVHDRVARDLHRRRWWAPAVNAD